MRRFELIVGLLSLLFQFAGLMCIASQQVRLGQMLVELKLTCSPP